MAVEKMSLVAVSGPLKRVNKALVRCCETKCFHIEPSYYTLTYGSAHFKTLKDKNIYGNLLKRAANLADGLGIKEKPVNYDEVSLEALHDFDMYFSSIEEEVGDLISEKSFLDSLTDQYKQALRQIENLSALDTDFRDLFNCKHVKVRFGRMPSDSYTKLEFYSEKSFIFVPLEENDGYVWGVYFASIQDSVQTDDIFTSLYFERIRIPDYVSGDGESAIADLKKQIAEFEEQRRGVVDKLEEIKNREEDKFLKVCCKLNFLNNSYELRNQVSVINNRFHMAGFVPTRELEHFKEKVSTVPDVEIEEKKYFLDERMKPPTKLRNNWLFRPFEMFVKMYGLPPYNGIDPTPYVAITFMLIYGIMFGDLGQGLVISLFGFILTKWRNVKLGPIMERIGISSAFFGFLYGSVFGNEEIIKPFFHIEPLYSAMGKPENIFQVSTYLLLAALGIGVILITISMIMNIVLSLKRRDYESAFFGANGVTGMVFYLAVVIAAALQLGLGIEMFTMPYILCLVLLPLAIMLFKEPMAHLVSGAVRHNVLAVKKASIADTAVRSSEKLSDEQIKSVKNQLQRMENMKYVRAVYGRMPSESITKLDSFEDKEFVYVPLSEENNFIYGVYFVPKNAKSMVDDIFTGLYFERMKMPQQLLRSERKKSSAKSEGEAKQKKSVGNFLIEGIIELFETCLSYLTNTMSFLRVGGFILSHAGMMLVVNVLAGDGVSAGSIIVQILGNAFVIGMEGFIVGIQVLRLEFYEIFGRFYKSDGKMFTPLEVKQ